MSKIFSLLLKLLKKVIYFFFYFIKEPLRIKKRYALYCADLTEMINRMARQKGIVDPANKNYIKDLRSQQVAAVNMFIILPFVTGIGSFIFVAFNAMDKNYPQYNKYLVYWKRIISPIDTTDIITTIQSLFNRIFLSIKYQPVGITEIIIILSTIILCFLGSKFLGKNPIWKKIEEIEFALLKMKKLDWSNEERPWKVVWTPYAIMFNSIGEDPNKFMKNNNFWKTISFKPSASFISFDEEQTKFIVEKRYRLPSKMKIKYNRIEIQEKING